MANLRADNLTGTGGRNAIDGSVYFRGYIDGVNSDYLKIPDSDDLDMGTGDFTFECWAKGIEHTGNGDKAMGIFSSGAFTAGGLLIQNKNTGPLRVVIPLSGGGYLDVNGTTSLWGNWNHIAVARSGSTLKAFVNGIEEISTTYAVGVDFAHGGYATVGENGYVTYPGDYPFRGYVSNLRLIKGTALYTAAFTPPTEKLTAVAGTTLLCCQDSDDPTQEATGKTITAVGNLDYSLSDQNLITNGNFDSSSVTGWTLASGSRALGTGQSGTFGDGNHLVLTSGTMTQAFTTVVGRTYFVCCQSNGADSSFISTTTSSGDAIITDIRSTPANLFGSGVRGHKSFVATQTTYYVILTGGGGGGNFDTVSVYEAETPKAPKVLPPLGIDEGVTFEGDTKVNSLGYMYFPTGDTSQRGRGRALYAGGYKTPNTVTTIDSIEIESGGITQKFGDLSSTSHANCSACSSSTRMVTNGGWTGGANNNTMEYVTIATSSNSTNFGDLDVGRRNNASVSNQTRGLVYGGNGTPANTAQVDYFTIANTGNAADFGDASSATAILAASASSTTRALFAGGYTPSAVDTIDYFTIASVGNYTDFGNLSSARKGPGGLSSSTRALFGGGGIPSAVNIIDYVTTASTGDATDFGDLFLARAIADGTSNGTRGIFMGGSTSPARQNTIDYVTIASTGNALDFGDFTVERQNGGATSDSHGGL